MTPAILRTILEESDFNSPFWEIENLKWELESPPHPHSFPSEIKTQPSHFHLMRNFANNCAPPLSVEKRGNTLSIKQNDHSHDLHLFRLSFKNKSPVLISYEKSSRIMARFPLLKK